MDKQCSIIAAHDHGLTPTVVDTLDRIGQGAADIAVGVGENVGNGLRFEVVEFEGLIWVQDALAALSNQTACRRDRNAIFLRDRFGVSVVIFSASDCGFVLQCFSAGIFELFDARLLVDGQWWRDSNTVDCRTLVRNGAPLFCILRQGWLDGGSTLKFQPLRRSYGAIDGATLE